MKRKLASLAVISCLIIGISNSPVFAEDTKAMEKSMSMKKMDSHAMNPMVKMNGESIHNLINMGHKMVKEGNSSGDADKMMMGCQMICQGMMIGHQTTMHMVMHMMHDKKMKKMHSKMSMDKIHSPEVMADIKNSMKMAAEVADMMMSMGNKMVKDGNTASDGKKMMTGGKMIDMGMKMHHMVIMGNKMMSDKDGMKKMMHGDHDMGGHGGMDMMCDDM